MKMFKLFFNFINEFSAKIKNLNHINSQDITIFLRQFSTLINAGIPLIQSCELLEKTQPKMALRLMVFTLKREILSGKNLFSGLRLYPSYFDHFVCQLIQVGEATGKLDAMLLLIAQYQERNVALKKQFKEALFYPCFVSVIGFIITIGMMINVIPRFALLFSHRQDTLPWFTRWIFYVSIQLNEHLFSIFFCLIIILLFLRQISKAHIKNLRHVVFLIPPIRKIQYKIGLGRFLRNLAISFEAGLPIMDTLKILTNISPLEFNSMLIQLRNKIHAGLQLHQAMEQVNAFPLLITQMIKIGEETGNLELMLNKMAHFIESDIDQLMRQLGKVVEPLIIVILGALIGGLVIGMYLPIFKLGSVL